MPLGGEAEGEVEGELAMAIVKRELDGWRCRGPAAARPIACLRVLGASWEVIESPRALARGWSERCRRSDVVVVEISELRPNYMLKCKVQCKFRRVRVVQD